VDSNARHRMHTPQASSSLDLRSSARNDSVSISSRPRIPSSGLGMSESRPRTNSEASFMRPHPPFGNIGTPDFRSRTQTGPISSSLTTHRGAGPLSHNDFDVRPKMQGEESSSRPLGRSPTELVVIRPDSHSRSNSSSMSSPPRLTDVPCAPPSNPPIPSQKVPNVNHSPPTSSATPNAPQMRPAPIRHDSSRTALSTASLAAQALEKEQQERRKAEKEREKEKGRERERERADAERSHREERAREHQQLATYRSVSSNVPTTTGYSYGSPAPTYHRPMTSSIAVGNGKGRVSVAPAASVGYL